MSKFTLILFVIAVLTSLITADKDLYCDENYHQYCISFGVLSFVNQTRCIDDDPGERLRCQIVDEPRLVLPVKKFFAIAPYVFRTTNFTELDLFSPFHMFKPCDRKVINVIPESFYGLESLRSLYLDCAEFTLSPNIFKTFESLDKLSLDGLDSTFAIEHLLPNLPKLTKLKLRQVNITAITDDFFSQMSHELQEISLIENNLTVIEGLPFRELRNLTELSIISNHLTVLRIDTLSELSQLKNLDLSRNRISEIEMGTCAGLPIERLDLSNNKLVDLPVGFFKILPNLYELRLTDNKISPIRSNFFEGLNPGVKLNLDNNDIHLIEPNAFRGLNLNYLNLEGHKLNPVENDTFNGLYIHNFLWITSYHYHFDVMKIEEQAFRNLTVTEIMMPSDTEFPKGRWGMNPNITVVNPSGFTISPGEGDQ